MGHYRSEMGFEDRDKSDAERKAQRTAKAIKNVEALIAEKGIAAVIVELAQDPTMFSIHHI